MRETTFEALDDKARVALEKAQRAMEENFFEYARALGFSLLERWPLCAGLRELVRRASLSIKPLRTERPTLYLRLAWTYLVHLGGRRRTLHFLNDLERILADSPHNRWVHQLFAQSAASRGYWQAARLSLEILAQKYPQLTSAQVLLAKAYVQLGRNDQAQSVITRVLKVDPHNDQAAEISRQACVGRILQTESV